MTNPNPHPNKDLKFKPFAALSLIVSGVLLEILLPLSDILRGKDFDYGKAQLILAGLGIFAILLGVGLFLFRLDPIPTIAKISKTIYAQIANFFHGFDDLLSRIFTKLSHPFQAEPKKFNWLDVSIISAFLMFSLIYSLGRWNGISPFIYLGSDASYISSYAAKLDNPASFSNDYFLANQANVDAYIAFHIPLLRSLNQLTGSYGNAFLILLPLALFFKLLGFYLLGKTLFSNRGLGALLAIITFPVIYTGAWDYWGLLGDALPRNLFDVAFPWILLLSLRWINEPKKWLILSGLLGIVTYIHSISGGIIFAVLCIVYLLQSPQPLSKRILHLIAISGVYLIIVSPFAYFYIKSMAAVPTVQLSYADKVAYMISFFGENHIDAFLIFSGTVQTLIHSGLLPLAGIAILFEAIFHRVKYRSPSVFWFFWIISLIFVTVVLPIIEFHFDNILHLINLQMMLVRGLRYLPPLLMLLIFECFFGQSKVKEAPFRSIFQLSGVVLLAAAFVLTINYNQQDGYFQKEVRCLSQGQLTCPTQQEKDGLEVIQSLDEFTSATDTVLSIPPLNTPLALAIRYSALRPMGYTMTDVRRLNTDVYKQNEIFTAMKPWNKLEHADPDVVLAAYFSLAKEVHADYLIVQKADFQTKYFSDLVPVFENDSYMLVKVLQ